MSRQTYSLEDYSFPAIGTLTVAFADILASQVKEGLTIPVFTEIPGIEIDSVNAKNFVSVSSKSTTQVVFEHGNLGDMPPFTFSWKIISNEADADVDTFYGTLSEAALLAGVGVGSLTEAMQNQINSWIENKIYNGNTITEHTETDEYYDIEKPLPGELLVKELILNHRPITSITSIVDDARGSSPTTVDSDCYVLDRGGETGIVKLESKAVTGSNVISGFTRGTHAVKVSYKWGFASVPTQIARLATLLLAKWAEINDQQSNMDGLKQIKAGNYLETYDLSFMNVKSKYDDEITLLTTELRRKYYQYV